MGRTDTFYRGSRGRERFSGRGRSGQRCGRGNSSFKMSNRNMKEKEYKFASHSTGILQYYHTYEKVKQHLYQKVSISFGDHAKDIIETIEDGSEIDFKALEPSRTTLPIPKMGTYDATNDEAKAAAERDLNISVQTYVARQRGNDIIYEDELRTHN